MSDVWVIDDAVPPELLRAALAEFPGPDWIHWHKYSNGNAVKFGTRDRLRIPPACWEVMRLLFAFPIQEETGIPNTFPDVELYGAGLHLIPAGGFVGRHLDSDHHPLTGWRREISGVLFLESNDGGALVIGGQEIAPEFNRLVLFSCTDNSWHSVDPPLHDRKTISVFWWSLSPSSETRPSAMFEKIPGIP